MLISATLLRFGAPLAVCPQVNAITKLDTGELMALKRMEKYAVLQSSSHLKMVWIERKVMSLASSPFLCNLLYAFESDKELFLVMPFMQGGDLRFHLKERGTMPVATCQFYASDEHTHTETDAHADAHADTLTDAHTCRRRHTHRRIHTQTRTHAHRRRQIRAHADTNADADADARNTARGAGARHLQGGMEWSGQASAATISEGGHIHIRRAAHMDTGRAGAVDRSPWAWRSVSHGYGRACPI